MDEQTYMRNVLARNSGQFNPHLVDIMDVSDLLGELCEREPMLDAIKKALVYGRTDKYAEFFQLPVDNPLDEGLHEHSQLIHAVLGHITESLELAKALKRLIDEGKLDTVNILEELGDANWYRVFGLHALGQTEADNREQNDRKLELRYGPTFSSERERIRDLQAEAAVLRQQAAEQPWDSKGAKNAIRDLENEAAAIKAKIGEA